MASKALCTVGSKKRTINLESNQSEESKEPKCQKLSIFPFEDLPDEIILNMLSFVHFLVRNSDGKPKNPTRGFFTNLKPNKIIANPTLTQKLQIFK